MEAATILKIQKVAISWQYLFCHLYTKMLSAGCGSRQCQAKSNLAEQNLQNFTISVSLC